MALTPENYESVLSKDLLKAAQKCRVRECDETDKGRFIAYVDENDESFDVSITIGQDQEISAHTCDCNNGEKFCRHKAAILLFIVKGKSRKTTTKPIKKVSKAAVLLNDVQLQDLKAWVNELLLKNKDTELAFIHHFSAKNYIHTPDEVRQLTNDAIKAVVKNKKNIDPTQLKKIVDLWANVHRPVVDHYYAYMNDEKAFLNFHSILETCLSFEAGIKIKNSKISKYIEELLQQSADHLNNIQDETIWTNAVKSIADLLTADNNIRLHYLLHLKNVLDKSRADRRKIVLDLVINKYRKCKPEHTLNGYEFTKLLYHMIEEYGGFAEHYDIFRPSHYDSEFNQKYIKGLIKIGKFDLAIKYCDEIIQGNFREEYNLPFLQLLKEIYKTINDTRNLAKVIESLLPFTFNYEDFVFISNRITDEDAKKKWREKMHSRAKNASRNYDKRAIGFTFALLDGEKHYKKMIDLIDSYTPYEIIYRYFEPLMLTDKSLLLKILIDKPEGSYWGLRDDSEKDSPYFFALVEGLLKYFTPDYLKKVVTVACQRLNRYRVNRFLSYLQEHLSVGTSVK